MPTTDDLRDAFATRAQDAPSVRELLAAIEPEPLPQRGHRRAVAAGASITGLAAAAVVVVTLAGAGGRPTSPAVASTVSTVPTGHATHTRPATARDEAAPTRLRFAFTLGTVRGYTLEYGSVAADVQVADVYVVGETDKSVGDIRVYSAGAFDPRPARENGTPVTVSGHPGYWTRIVDPDTTDGRGHGTSKWSVVWQYAPDAWAVVQGDWARRIADGDLTGDAKTIELAVAGAVDTSATHPLPVPIRLTYLPAGLVVRDAGLAPDDSQAEVGLSDGGPTDPAYPGNTDSVQIQVHAYDPGRGAISPTGGVPLRGPRAYQDGQSRTVTVLYGDRYLTVAYAGTAPQRTSGAELLRIANGIRISPSMRDRSTWFDGLTIGP